MEVILIKDVPHLGRMGEVVKVKNGFARNYLLPRSLAYLATSANLKKIETQAKARQEQHENERKAALEIAEKLNKVSCTVNVEVNDLDKLYGSISEADVVKALEVEGFKFDKKQVVFDAPIEELGIFDVGINLHHDVTAKVRLWVTKK